MGGWAALLGGVGAGAQQYGNQVRGFLEGRRRDLADTMLNLAAQEPDEQLRGEYLGHASDLLSGKPMAKMLPAIGKTVQGHLQDNNTLAQLLPPPSGQQQTYAGQAPLGQMSGTRVAEPQMPPSAAMAPTSPVNPLAQAGQEAAGPMVQAPGPATQSPFAFTPTPANIPGTTLPEGSAPQARMSATPPINPSPADLEQTAVPQSYVDRVLQHPYMRTPAGRQILSPVLQQASEMDRQLGLSHEYVRQKMNYLADYTNQLRQMYQDPNLPQIGRMALQAHAMDMQAWAANPDINARQPTFPLTGGNMLQAMRGRIQSVDVSSMPPDVKGYYGIPESATGAQLLSTDPLSNQIREGGWVGQASPQMRPETVWDNATRSFQQMAVDVAHPGEGPLGFGDQGGRYQYPPPGFAQQPIVNTATGAQAYGVSRFEAQQDQMRRAATEQGKLTGGLRELTPTGGYPSFVFSREHQQMATIEGPGGKSQQVQVPSVTRTLPIGAAGGGAQPAAETAGAGPTPPGLPPGTRVIGNKPQTPHQIMTNEQQLYQENKALGQIQYLKDHAQVFAGLIDAGKIELGLQDGLVKNVLTRAVTYTPEQAAVVQAFNSLGESVGILRNALGGGFRSHDAFLRLQATKGSVMQNPQLTSQILGNLAGEFQGQAVPLARSIGGQVYGLKTLPPVGALPAELGGTSKGPGSDLYNRLRNKYKISK